MAARNPAAAPGRAPATVTRLARRQRQVPLAALGAVLVAGSALAAASLFRAGTARVEVLVAARDLDPSRPLSPADLRTTQAATSSTARYLAPSGAAGVLGQLPRGPVPAGTPLNAAMFAPTQALGPGEVVVGAVLDPGAVPTPSLRVGDTVEAIAVATTKGAPASASGAQDLGRVTVYGVSSTAPTGRPSATDKTWVSLRAPASVGTAIAQAAQDGSLRLVLAGGG